MQTQASFQTPFGVKLRRLREWRGLSQLKLSAEAEVSTRHLSFLETGRAQPSRELVSVLATVLDVPPLEKNDLLMAAGFAPELARPPRAREAEIEQAMQMLLELYEPFPAIAMDRHYTVVGVNAGVRDWFHLAPELYSRFKLPGNGMRMIFEPELLRACIHNFAQLAPLILQRFYREVHARPGDRAGQELFEEMLALSGLSRRQVLGMLPESTMLIIPVELGLHDTRLRYITTQASVGTAVDMTLAELRIEVYMPADAATRAVHAGARAALPTPGPQPPKP